MENTSLLHRHAHAVQKHQKKVHGFMAWNLFFSKSLKTLLSAPGPNLRRPIMFDLVRHLQDLRTAVACPAALTSRTAVAFPAALTSILGYSGRFVGAGRYQISGPDADYHPEDHPINLHPSGDIQNPEVRISTPMERCRRRSTQRLQRGTAGQKTWCRWATMTFVVRAGKLCE